MLQAFSILSILNVREGAQMVYLLYLYRKLLTYLGMAMGRVFSGTRPTPPLMGRGSILINGFGTGLEIFFKTRDGFEYCLAPPHPVYNI